MLFRSKRSLSSFSQSPYPVTTKNNQNYVASNNLSEIEDKDTFIRNKNNADYKLGTLSSKHESLRNPAAIGHDNAGGYSYGSYQIATKTGTMKSYIDYLKQNTKYLNYYNMLINAGGNDAALIKTEEFEQTWKYLSKNADFNQSQKQFLIETHLNRLLNSVKEKNLLNLDDIVTGKDTRTTVMIRNIPIKYTDNILIKDLEEFKGKYDCLYMPYDYEKKGNKGYAFINFVNPLHILYFHEKFNGKKWPLFESNKICELNSANFQGIYEIQKHSKNYKGYKKPLFYSEPNKNNSNKENIIIPSKYLNKLKVRFPKIKFKENKAKKIITVDSFE